jgi:hypothetical protein
MLLFIPAYVSEVLGVIDGGRQFPDIVEQSA